MQEVSISLKPDTIAYIGDFPITNSLWVSFLVTIVLLLVFGIVNARKKTVPGVFQLLIETCIIGCEKLVESTTGSKTVARKVFPLFTTLVVFFLVANLLGILPWWSAFSVGDIPLYRAATTDYTLIFVITMCTFIIWQVVAVVTGGVWRYIKSYKNPLDLIGEVAKIVSLSFRLFGNIFAGEVIATIIAAIIPYIIPVPFAVLGLLSSVIQALVFPILVLIFISMAVTTPEDIEEELEKKKAKKAAKQAKQEIASS